MISTVILAGGEGSRFKPVNPNIPKCLFEVGGKTLLSRIIDELKIYHLDNINIFTRLNTEVITQYLNQYYQELKVNVYQEMKYKGTGAGLFEHFEKLDDTILIIMSDLMMKVDFQKIISYHLQNTSKITLVCHPSSHMEDSDLVVINKKGQVSEIKKQNPSKECYDKNITMAGIIVLQKEVLSEVLNKVWTVKDNIDLTKDIVIKSLQVNIPIDVYLTTEYIKDAGTLIRAKEVNDDFKRNYIFLKNNRKRPLVFLDRDGTINELNGHIRSEQDIKLKVGVSESIRKLNDSGVLVAVVTNQPVIARGECSENKLESIHNYLELIINKESGGFFDEILYCPHYPEIGFAGEVTELKMKCLCRKPGIKLYEEIINKLDPDLNLLFAVGDSRTDVEAGNKVGAKTYLISDSLEQLIPQADFKVSGLGEAVDLILEEVFK
jgi:mannose-1-phosphate guanylyltransferase/phosphomannomutase